MENQACPCGGWGGPCLQPHAGGKGHLSPRENPPFSFAAASKRAYAGGLFEARLSQATRGGGVSTPETWGSGRVFSSPQARRGSGSGGSGGPPSLLPRGSAGSAGTGPATPPPPPAPS